MAQVSAKDAKESKGASLAPGASLGTGGPLNLRVEVPRSMLAHFSQPEVHISIDNAARILGFAGEKELRRYVGPIFKQDGEDPPGTHVGALAFKRLVSLCAGKTTQARKLLEDFLAHLDVVNLPAAPLMLKGSVPGWPQCAPEAVGMDKAPFARLSKYFEWRANMKHFGGIACGVVKNGMLVYYQEAGYANVESKVKMSGDTMMRLFSMTKCLVAAAFMTFIEDTSLNIDLDDPVAKYISAFAPSQMSVLPKRGQKDNQPLERPITLRHLLTHTSGIGYGATLDDPWPPEKGSYYKIYEELCEKTRDGTIRNLEEWCNVLAKVPLKGQPGVFWDYSYSLDVLGRVVEVIAGKTLDVVLEERICGPLKMRDTSFAVPKDQAHRLGPWYKSVEADGNAKLCHLLEVVDRGGEDSGWIDANASKVLSGGGTVEVPLAMKGGMVSTFNDYLRFLLMIRNGGELDGVRVLKKETIQLMILNHVPAACNGKKTVFVFDKPGVGFNAVGQIQAQHPKQDKGSCSGEFGWGGLAGPAWTIDPRSDLIVLSMTQTAFVLDHEEYLRYAARRAIHQHIYGSVAAPAKATSYPPECFDVVRPKGDPGKATAQDEAASFEEEFQLARQTRTKTAKERAILPGARLDRHPSEEADGEAAAAKAGQEEGAAPKEAVADGTPAAKRRRSTVGTVSAADVASPATVTKALPSPNTGNGKAASPRSADPSKPGELLFSRVALRSGENGPDSAFDRAAPTLQKARVTAVQGDLVEVVTEGCFSTRNVKVGELSFIEESQMGTSTAVRANDPKEFPLMLPQKLPQKTSG